MASYCLRSGRCFSPCSGCCCWWRRPQRRRRRWVLFVVLGADRRHATSPGCRSQRQQENKGQATALVPHDVVGENKIVTTRTTNATNIMVGRRLDFRSRFDYCCWWSDAIFGEWKPRKFGDRPARKLHHSHSCLPHLLLVLAAKRLFLVFRRTVGRPFGKKNNLQHTFKQFRGTETPVVGRPRWSYKVIVVDKRKACAGIGSLLRPGVLDFFRQS
jgi:hypothetical protein